MPGTFASAFDSSARYRSGGEPAVAWLIAIAQRKLIDAEAEVESRARARQGRLRTGMEVEP